MIPGKVFKWEGEKVTKRGVVGENKWLSSPGKILAVNFLLLMFIVLFWISFLRKGPDIVRALSGGPEEQSLSLQPGDAKTLDSEMSLLKKDIDRLKLKLGSFIPHSSYLVVNTRDNSFKLYKEKELIREGKCSTGSYIMLRKGEQEKWIFKTPKGVFRIQGKTRAPVWKKPDWAFIEQGLPVPSANHPSRYEYGVLGDYSLSLGDGYLLHGTLYKRLLGMPVTHGCIRLNDEDLEAIYKQLPIGAKVYIF